MGGGRLSDAQVAEEVAIAVAEALHRSVWSDGPVRVQHVRQAVLETLARCRVTLAPAGERPRVSDPVPLERLLQEQRTAG